MKNPAKARKEFERVYGSLDRVEWVKQQPCIVSGLTPCHNAHTATGGMGRKAHYSSIVPLHHTAHTELHTIGQQSFEAKYALDLHDEAARTERDWQRHLRDTFGTLTKP